MQPPGMVGLRSPFAKNHSMWSGSESGQNCWGLNNGRAQPFQGWILPKLSVDFARLSSDKLSDLFLFIGAKMEPSCKNLSLPRFASIRQGFQLAMHKVRFQRTLRKP